MMLARFLRLPPAERRLVVVLVPLLAVVRIAVAWARVPRVRRLAAWLAPRSAAEPLRLAELVASAGRMLPGDTRCLARAIGLEALLLKAGHAAELRIGLSARQGRDRPDAHAWVELGGRAVGEDASAYTPLPLFGARG
jgi:hypothetical protein